MRDLPAPRLELVDDPRPALSATGEMSSRRDVASIAFAAVLKLRGALDTLAPWAFVDRFCFVPTPAADLAADAKKKKKYGRRGQTRTPRQDSSRVCRLISARRYGQATSLSRRAARDGDGERARTGE